jgi:hypothetical protein
VFAQVDALDGALRATALAVRGLRFDAARMLAAAEDGLTVATDVAEALVRSGVPFRQAHAEVAGRIAAGERFTTPSAAGGGAGTRRPGMPGRWRDQLAALERRVLTARAAPVTAAARRALPRRDRPGPTAGLTLGGVPAAMLAERFGTPLYVYDAATLRRRARAYVEPLGRSAGRRPRRLRPQGQRGAGRPGRAPPGRPRRRRGVRRRVRRRRRPQASRART